MRNGGVEQEYQPFGSLLPGRNYSNSNYRWGFNGAEKDDEVHGSTGTSYNFGSRILDPRVGRWLSMDPYATSYPDATPYGFAANSPLMFVDPDGERLRFSLAMRLFHPSVYKATLSYIKSESGKEIYRDVVNARQARKFWGDAGGKGSLHDNVTVRFGIDPDQGGSSPAFFAVDGQYVNGSDLTPDHVRKMSAQTHMLQYVNISTNQPIGKKEDGTYDMVQGDLVAIYHTAGHESTVHVKYALAFARHFVNGTFGEDLVKVFDQKYGAGFIDLEHQAAHEGWNMSHTRFSDEFKAKFFGVDPKKVGNIMQIEHDYNDFYQKDELMERVDPEKGKSKREDFE